MPTLRITLLSTLIGAKSCTSLEQHKPHWLWHSVGYTTLWHNLPRQTLLKQCGTKTDYPARDFVVKRFIDQPWNSSLMQRKFTLSEKMYSICPSSSLRVVVLWKKGRWESHFSLLLKNKLMLPITLMEYPIKRHCTSFIQPCITISWENFPLFLEKLKNRGLVWLAWVLLLRFTVKCSKMAQEKKC